MRGEHKPILSADDLVAKLRAGKKEVHEISHRDLKIPVRVLSIDETNAIRRDSIKRTQATGGDQVDRDVHIQKMTLKLASKVSDDAPLLNDKFLGLVSVDEINFLYSEYIRCMDSVNPTVETISQDEFMAIVTALKKNTISARDLSLMQLKAICTAFVDMIQKLDSQNSQKDNSSGGPL